jgi:PEP-CTERM motif
MLKANVRCLRRLVAVLALCIGATGAAHADTVQFSGGFSTYTFTGSTPDAGCPTGARANYDSTSGLSTVQGAATGSFSQCVRSAGSSVVPGGQITLDAVDGSGSIFGVLSPINYFESIFNGFQIREGFAMFTITGGTLTYADATGSAFFHNFENVTLGMGSLGLTAGTISAPGIKAPIPEPATLLLLGTGLGGVATALRKRRKAQGSERL